MPKLARDRASQINPFIGISASDTMEYISDGISLFQDYSLIFAHIEFSEDSANGFFLLGQTLRKAIEFEVEQGELDHG